MNKQARKEEIRKKLLDRRSRIPEEEYHHKSSNIIERVQDIPETGRSQIIHCYISINQRREVNTHPLIKELISSGHDVAVPITHMDSGLLTHVIPDDFDNMQPNEWNIPEPPEGEVVSEEDLDLVIVPMVGGDLNRNRIGYGKGFYDRFLRKVSCPKVGLLFETCLIKEVPVEPFDVRLDTLITEDRVIS